MAHDQIPSDALAEVRAMGEVNRPYWRVLLTSDEPVRFVAVCLQPFDEPDYPHERFLADRIASEAEAEWRATHANTLLPPSMRTVRHIRVVRRAHGLR